MAEILYRNNITQDLASDLPSVASCPQDMVLLGHEEPEKRFSTQPGEGEASCDHLGGNPVHYNLTDFPIQCICNYPFKFRDCYRRRRGGEHSQNDGEPILVDLPDFVSVKPVMAE